MKLIIAFLSEYKADIQDLNTYYKAKIGAKY